MVIVHSRPALSFFDCQPKYGASWNTCLNRYSFFFRSAFFFQDTFTHQRRKEVFLLPPRLPPPLIGFGVVSLAFSLLCTGSITLSF